MCVCVCERRKERKNFHPDRHVIVPSDNNLHRESETELLYNEILVVGNATKGHL